MTCECGEKRCNGLCEYNLGKRVHKFLSGAQFMDTHMGETTNDASMLMVVGSQLYKDRSQSRVLSVENISIPRESKFDFVSDGDTAFKSNLVDKALKTYLSKRRVEVGLTAEEAIDKLRMFELSKSILIPVRPGNQCTITYTRTKNKDKDDVYPVVSCGGVIESIKFFMNKNTKKSECLLTTSVVNCDTSKKVVIPLEMYGESFTVDEIQSSQKKTPIREKLIKMSKFGYIKPIEFTYKEDNGNSLVVDGSGVYIKSDNKERMIGTWNETELDFDAKLAGSIVGEKMVKSLTENTKYIYMHRKYIMPYKLVETNKIEFRNI